MHFSRDFFAIECILVNMVHLETIERTITGQLKLDLSKKIVLLSGPRQVGKTYLSQRLFPENFEYLNFDRKQDRSIILAEGWSRNRDLVIFDEIHKMKVWKRWIKGIYDTEKIPPRLLATGSARLDIFRRGGDSLAGRHHLYRLHPLSVAEMKGHLPSEEVLSLLLQRGGFPEPFLSQSEIEANRWRKSHLDRILREDLLDLEKVRELKQLEILVDLLSERVGSTVSYASLAKDIEVSPHTIKKWVQVLENLFVIFVVTPYSKNIARSILKEPKIYFFDTGRVKPDPGARFENLVACSLLKRQHYLEDCKGETLHLHYLKDKEKKEVDFLTIRNKTVEYLIETKLSDGEISPHLQYFTDRIQPLHSIQLVRNLHREQSRKNIQILQASKWLESLES